jgi:hypothetical protein
LPTCGKACITVSSSARIPFAIFSSFSTEKQNDYLETCRTFHISMFQMH